jgi:hypothetical protein
VAPVSLACNAGGCGRCSAGTARSANTEGAQSAVETSLHFFHAVTLSGKELPPGIYRLLANSSKVRLKQSGKVVAEAPVVHRSGIGLQFAMNLG